VKFLFIKENLAWPRSSGHDVHCFYMMQSLATLGHQVSLATLKKVSSEAIARGGLSSVHLLTGRDISIAPPIKLTSFQEKYRNYWGVREDIIREIGQLARVLKTDAVVVVGLNVLPYLGAIENSARIWYAGDEWFWHHWSQVNFMKPKTWNEFKEGAIKGFYERKYSSLCDRTWVVSDSDRRAMKWIAGHQAVDVLPNGVDTVHYSSTQTGTIPNSAVFWGRLDFGPNIQALEWFCKSVWPQIRYEIPSATFTIYGFQPTRPVLELARDANGIRIIADQPDIRSDIQRHRAVVLPFVSGGGIKNKLLEAAALGQAIICTSRTVKGLSCSNAIVTADSPRQWLESLKRLFSDSELRSKLGLQARSWVEQEHTWDAVASIAAEGVEETLRNGRSCS
jgi:glycosyltransferase involved in cell wall biosynthesis